MGVRGEKRLRSGKYDCVCTLSWNKGQDRCSDSLFCLFVNSKGGDISVMVLNMIG